MAQLFPFSNMGVNAIQAPVESLELSGYMKGLEASKRDVTTATAVNRGISAGLDSFNKQVDASQRQESNDLKIQQQEADLARQPVIDQTEQLKLEIAQLEMARAKETNDLNLKLTKEKAEQEYKTVKDQGAMYDLKQEAMGKLSADSSEEARKVFTDPKYKPLLLDPALEDQFAQSLVGSGHWTKEEYAAFSQRKNAKAQLLLEQKQKAEQVKAYDESKQAFESSVEFPAIANQLGVNASPNASAVVMEQATMVPHGKYIEDPNNPGKISGIDPDYGTPGKSNNLFDLVTKDGRILNKTPIDNKTANSFSTMVYNASKAAGKSVGVTEQDFAFLDAVTKPAEKPEEKSWWDSLFGGGEETPKAPAPTVASKLNVNPSILEAKRKALSAGIQAPAPVSAATTAPSPSASLNDRANAAIARAQSMNPEGANRANQVVDAVKSGAQTAINETKKAASETSEALKSGAKDFQKSSKEPLAELRSKVNKALGKENVSRETSAKQTAPAEEGFVKKPVSYKEYYDIKPPKKGTADYVAKAVNTEPLLASEPILIRAVAAQESAGVRNAVSTTDVKGLLQVTDKTAKWIGEITRGKAYDRNIPEENVEAGKAYLGYLFKYMDKNVPLMLGAYNGGQGTIDKALKAVGMFENKKEATWSDVVTGLQALVADNQLSKAKFKEIAEYPMKVYGYAGKIHSHEKERAAIEAEQEAKYGRTTEGA